MKVQVKLFAIARQLAGAETVQVEVEEPATVGGVRKALVAQYPQLAPTMKHMLVAVEGEYAPKQMVLRPEWEVALIPPVSGG